MKENEDLMKHMNKFNRIIYQLNKVDVKVEEEEKALLFLASLLDSYELDSASTTHKNDFTSWTR
ncbi:hypothetical protein QQP08_001068 [Theobroma cacao]|nr:hypothetical protein QQP08_001068 [Theobroma cacao]